MIRIQQFNDSIDKLEKMIRGQLPGYFIAEHMNYIFKYCIDLENNSTNDIMTLRGLCENGLPFREIEAFDKETIESIYLSFNEMKKILIEKEKKT